MISTAFAHLFQHPGGDVVLKHLKHLTQERVLPPSATQGELYFLEGQRALVALILSLIKQGQQKGENT